MKIKVRDLKKHIANIKEEKSDKLRELIKEETEEQNKKEMQFDHLVQKVNDAVERFTDFLVKQGTSPEEYRSYMDKFNKIFTGIKHAEMGKIQIKMSKLKFLGKDKKEEEKPNQMASQPQPKTNPMRDQ